MLAAVGEVPGIRRVRFTTSHPRDFGRDIIDAIDAHPTLCDHVHLPVQSGSSRVLKAMLREYTREDYLERIAWMKSARRHISMTTDVIVGFPGETDQEFEETISLLGEVGYDGVFSFKYSPRPNTPAIRMSDSIPDEEKSKRLSILQERQREIQRSSYEATVAPDGTLAYVVHAQLLLGQGLPRIGLRGTAKIYAERVTLGYYLLRKPLAFLRRTLGI